ncbi:MAG: hypothetical protein K0R17_605 [Rariglobus sp.]|nr:hypothetical protein [Rariglobus sp.]
MQVNALRHLREGRGNLSCGEPAGTPRRSSRSNVMSRRDTRFNTPAEMLVRFIFAARYLLFFGGLFMMISALHAGSIYEAAQALIFFAGMGAGHWWLKSRGKLEECDRALEVMFGGGVTPDENDGLEALLQRRERLEERRGKPGFNPWEVQALRREINDYVREHPEASRDIEGRW